MICGIASIVLPFLGLATAIAALIFGLIGRKQIQTKGGTGMGQALVGIVLGSFFFAFYAILIAVLITAHVTNCRHGFNC